MEKDFNYFLATLDDSERLDVLMRVEKKLYHYKDSEQAEPKPLGNEIVLISWFTSLILLEKYHLWLTSPVDRP